MRPSDLGLSLFIGGALTSMYGRSLPGGEDVAENEKYYLSGVLLELIGVAILLGTAQYADHAEERTLISLNTIGYPAYVTANLDMKSEIPIDPGVPTPLSDGPYDMMDFA